MSTTDEQRLREASTASLAVGEPLRQALASRLCNAFHGNPHAWNHEDKLDRKAWRICADIVLAQQAPTPAVPKPVAYMVTRKIRTNQDGRARYLHINKERAEEDFDLWQEAGGADPVLIPLYAEVSEPAAPVDARDALLMTAMHALRSYQYGNGAPDLAKATADKIDAAIARQAAAPSSTDEFYELYERSVL